MSYTSIPNQPLIFQTIIPEGCEGCDSGYSQLVDFNDQLFTQFECTPCDVPLFTTGEAVFSAGCVTSGLTVTKNTPNQTWVAYWEFAQLMQYDVIKVVVQVTSIQGVLLVQDQYSSFEINTAGTHVLYFPNFYFNVPQYTVGFGGTNAVEAFQGECEIISVEGIPIGGLFMGLVDAVTLQPVATIFPTITKVDNIMTVGFDMSDYEIEAGCYRLAIADFCENTCGQYYIQNPFFNCLRSGVPNWTDITTPANGGTVTIDCNILTICGETEEAIGYAMNSVQVCEGVEYSYTIEIQSGMPFPSGALQIFVTDGTNFDYSNNIATEPVGTITGTFTPDISGNIGLCFTTYTGAGCVEITFFQIRARQEDAVYDKFSDVLSIGNYSDPCRYFKIEGCNGENQFGFAFYGSSFLPSIRLEGRRFQPQYDTDTELFRYASGRWSANYVDRRKKLSYYFGRLPEYVFDFLSIVFYFDNCYVNGVTHVPVEAEFPNVEYNDADDLGALNIELYKQSDKVRKTICSGTDANCLPSILDLGSEPFILAQDGDRLLTENNVNLYQE
jgi:hypothetical protein